MKIIAWNRCVYKFKQLFHINHEFDANEELLAYKVKMLHTILIIVSVFTLIFALLSDFGINDLGPIHTKVDYLFSLSSLMLLFMLRLSKQNYTLVAYGLYMIALLSFTSALIFVPQDEFRLIWFYLLVFVAFITSGLRAGIIFTLASIFIIMLVKTWIDIELSDTAVNSAVLGLIITSLLMYSYTKKIDTYEKAQYKRNRELEILAATDSLTGIMNRRAFDTISQSYFESAKRDEYPLSLLVLDLDYFKTVNDKFGHKIGDDVLIEFTKVISTLLRKSDIFARIGGEEFTILLFKTDNIGAYTLAEKIRQTIQNHTFEGNLSLTVSIGLSSKSRSDSSSSELFERADKALYTAKQLGRNQIYNEQ